MKIHTFEQGSEEWFKVRLGKLTGSEAQAIATAGKGLETLAFEKVAEIMTGKLKTQYTNEDMERGKELEAIARNYYEVESGNLVKRVGFIEFDEYTGASPDGLVGEDGTVEIKCKNDPLFARFLYEKKVEAAHNWQIQFGLWVADRKFCDYIIFNENFPKTTEIVRVKRNEEEITKIKSGVVTGVKLIKQILEKINS